MKLTAIAAITALTALAACKPPPTDADLGREVLQPELTFASEPLPSPETEGAVWAPSTQEGRIIYGIPGEPALLSLSCLTIGDTGNAIRIMRLAEADEGAQALLALIGNGAIGRIEVDSTKVGNRHVWQGELPADNDVWEPLAGPRQLTVTVPGAGIVSLNSSAMPRELLEECRSNGRDL